MALTTSTSALARQALDSLQPVSEFDEFVSSYFVEVVQQRFATGMNRKQQTTELLLSMGPEEVLRALAQHQSTSPDNDNRRAKSSEQSEARVREKALLQERLATLRAERSTLAAAHGSTDSVEQTILAVRRRLRELPQLTATDALGDGRYVLRKQVGRGGFASVWLAHDRDRNRDVAVKVLHSQLAAEATPRDRFLRGARRMADISHPHVMQVLDSPKEEDGFYFFVTPYFPDGDLHQAIMARRITRQQGIDIVLQAGDALYHAHQHSLIHRDVKPSNILISPDAQAALGDFDMVWCPNTTGGTKTGAGGTLVFSAPETQLAGASIWAYPPEDQYSLAMTLAFVLFGKEINLSMIIDKGLSHFIDQIGCSRSLRRVLHRALARKPGERYGSVEDFCQAVRAERGERAAIQVPPAGPAARSTLGSAAVPSGSQAARLPRTIGAALGALSLLLLGGSAGGLLGLARRPHPEREPAPPPSEEKKGDRQTAASASDHAEAANEGALRGSPLHHRHFVRKLAQKVGRKDIGLERAPENAEQSTGKAIHLEIVPTDILTQGQPLDEPNRTDIDVEGGRLFVNRAVRMKHPRPDGLSIAFKAIDASITDGENVASALDSRLGGVESCYNERHKKYPDLELVGTILFESITNESGNIIKCQATKNHIDNAIDECICRSLMYLQLPSRMSQKVIRFSIRFSLPDVG